MERPSRVSVFWSFGDIPGGAIIRDYYEKGGVITGIITPAQTVETPMRAPEGRRPEGARSGSRPFEKGVIIPLHPDFFVIIFLS